MRGADFLLPVIPMKPLHTQILRTLLYYDIWQYPLTAKELYTFLPANPITFDEFGLKLRADGPGDSVLIEQGHYFVKGRPVDVVGLRKQRERHARLLWHAARISTHIIKRFPFVRGIFVSGDLSKNATTSKSDVDFFIITDPNRLWIARTLLILFKKVFLFNSKKFFCLNYFVASDHLMLDERNIYTASEVAHLRPLYNSGLFTEYLRANKWIVDFFPNFEPENISYRQKTNNRQSAVQRILEVAFQLLPLDRLDEYLLRKMKAVWAKRYPDYDDATRNRIFRCTKHESRAYGGNFEDKVLTLYEQRLREFGVGD